MNTWLIIAHLNNVKEEEMCYKDIITCKKNLNKNTDTYWVIIIGKVSKIIYVSKFEKASYLIKTIYQKI